MAKRVAREAIRVNTVIESPPTPLTLTAGLIEWLFGSRVAAATDGIRERRRRRRTLDAQRMMHRVGDLKARLRNRIPTSRPPGQRKPSDRRIPALRQFAGAITGFTLAGAFLLGFEDSWAQPVVALVVAYSLDLLLESIEAWAQRRRPRFYGGPVALLDFLLPAHITALSIALLLYPGSRLTPIVFAVVVAIASKFVFRVATNGRKRHFLNPSNFAITVTLLAFPAVGLAPPYHFTETVSGALDWAIPLGLLVAGTSLNVRLTGKGPLIVAWLGGFVAQALFRATVFDVPLAATLLPMTGVAFLLFTNYMITDPGTTPVGWRGQIVFGVATAAIYGALVTAHVVFGLFIALTIVSAARGLLHVVISWRTSMATLPVPPKPVEPVPARAVE